MAKTEEEEEEKEQQWHHKKGNTANNTDEKRDGILFSPPKKRTIKIIVIKTKKKQWAKVYCDIFVYAQLNTIFAFLLFFCTLNFPVRFCPVFIYFILLLFLRCCYYYGCCFLLSFNEQRIRSIVCLCFSNDFESTFFFYDFALFFRCFKCSTNGSSIVLYYWEKCDSNNIWCFVWPMYRLCFDLNW